MSWLSPLKVSDFITPATDLKVNNHLASGFINHPQHKSHLLPSHTHNLRHQQWSVCSPVTSKVADWVVTDVFPPQPRSSHLFQLTSVRAFCPHLVPLTLFRTRVANRTKSRGVNLVQEVDEASRSPVTNPGDGVTRPTSPREAAMRRDVTRRRKTTAVIGWKHQAMPGHFRVTLTVESILV